MRKFLYSGNFQISEKMYKIFPDRQKFLYLWNFSKSEIPLIQGNNSLKKNTGVLAAQLLPLDAADAGKYQVHNFSAPAARD